MCFSSCKKQVNQGEIINSNKLLFPDSHIQEAYDFYTSDVYVSSRSSDEENLNDLQLNWDSAKLTVLDANRQFVIVPIVVETPELLADLIFYLDSCGISNELWAYLSTTQFQGNRHEIILNGSVIVVNDCRDSNYVFTVKDSETIYCKSIPFPTNDLTGDEVESRTKAKFNAGAFYNELMNTITAGNTGGGGTGGGNSGGDSGSGSSGMGSWSNYGAGNSGNPNVGNNVDNPYGVGSNFLQLISKFKNENGIDLSNVEYIELAEESWVLGIDYDTFSNIVKNKLIDQLLNKNPNISFSQLERNWLEGNFKVFYELDKFLDSHPNDNTSVVVSKSYLGLLMSNNQEVLQLLNDMRNAQIGDPIWEIIKEQLALILTDIVADIVPGGMVITIGPQLLQNLQQGKYMEAMWNAIDIALNEADTFFPPAKIASTTFSVIEKSVQLSKFYDAFKKMKTLGDDVVYRVYLVLRNKIDKLFSKMDWKGNPDGAHIEGFGDPLDIWEELISQFPGGTASGGNGNEIVYTFNLAGSSFKMKFYQESTTPPHCPTISIQKTSGGAFTYKMRFCE